MTLQGKHLHVDCASGAAGDMMLGALLDLGVPVDVVGAALDAIGAGRGRMIVTKVTKHGIAATDVKVNTEGSLSGRHPHTHAAPPSAAHATGHHHDHGPESGDSPRSPSGHRGVRPHSLDVVRDSASHSHGPTSGHAHAGSRFPLLGPGAHALARRVRGPSPIAVPREVGRSRSRVRSRL